MGTRRLVPLALAALLLGVTAPAATAAPAVAAVPAPDPCGYFTRGHLAFYNHCTNDGSRIQIKIDRINVWDTKHCVDPGTTQLGTTAQIRNAWYTGKLCRPRSR
ncbi:DUF6355 family natural product biosynthesis protein [Streptomyces albidochromogenes]|uniref:DUF6355 family natural product biosynthesis protein n=2 Tax=Streptomyces albidochromogenes TaxID=329524 RepID=UPI00110FE71E|nr:DUF6355 family natural product biosynthesis protein [Streptomyces albidochromogenes]